MDSPERLTSRHAGAAFIAQRIAEIAHELPELEELSPEDAARIMRLAVVDELKDQVRRRVAAERLDWKAQRLIFISDKTSQRTRVIYERALALLEDWMGAHKLTPSDLTPREADDFIRELRGRQSRSGGVLDADSVRLVVSVASSFFTFLERRDATIRNPFRGTKIRPRSTWPVATIPSQEEIPTLIAEAKPVLAAALAVVAETGLRVGGLPTLSIREEGRYWTISKGHQIVGSDPISKEAKRFIRVAQLDPQQPFSLASLKRIGWKWKDQAQTSAQGLLTARLQMELQRLCLRLVAEGKIKAVYSFHDLRHAYAEANASKGLRWLQRRLGHAAIAITEKYLRNTLALDTEKL
ncbi:MAG: tyrosine-type recombinase/integrase [Spirochaetia bacterium]